MKTSVKLLWMILFFTTVRISAQQGKNMQNRKVKKAEILEKKIKFLKNNLELTPKQSADFEKIYRSYIQKKQKLGKAYREQIFQKMKDKPLYSQSDKEINILIDKKLELDRKKFKLENNLVMQLREVLPPYKVMKYFRLEKQFNKKLMERLRKRKHRAM